MGAYNAIAQFIAGAGQVTTAVRGNPKLVQFLDADGNTLVQFDATLQESYDRKVQPTGFPIEDGSTITDHLVRAPTTLSLVGIVSDTPFDDRHTITGQAIATAVALPLGVLGTVAAYTTWLSDQNSARPSVATYAKLCAMLTGNPQASPPVPPAIFTVSTAIGSFQNMVIVSLSVPRDAETGGCLIFQIDLSEVVIVATQSLTVASVPALAGAKARLGNQEASTRANDTFTPGRLAGGRVVSENLSVPAL